MKGKTNRTEKAGFPNQRLDRKDLFISYARQDIDTTRALSDALEARGKIPTFDVKDIQAADVWGEKIQALIEEADNVVFLMTNASLESIECEKERRFAESINKRIITIRLEDIRYDGLDEQLRKINWIDAVNKGISDSIVDQLVEALETDQDWVQLHTRIGLRQRDWSNSNYQSSHLLRGKELKEVEVGVDRFSEKKPSLTEDQKNYLEKSRESEKRRQKLRIAGILGLIILIISSIVIIKNRMDQAQQTRAENYWNSAISANKENKSLEAIHYFALSGKEEKNEYNIKDCTFNIQQQSNIRLIAKTKHKLIKGATLSQNGNLLLTWGDNGKAHLWNTEDGTRVNKEPM